MPYHCDITAASLLDVSHFGDVQGRPEGRLEPPAGGVGDGEAGLPLVEY